MKTIVVLMRTLACALLLASTGLSLPLAAQNTLTFANAVENPFGLSLETPSENVSYAFHTADLDGDGDLDLLVTAVKHNPALQTQDPGGVFYFENAASAGCPPDYVLKQNNQFNFPAGSLRSLVLADIDADGDQDMFSNNGCNCAETAIHFYQNENGAFSGQIDKTNPFEIKPNGIQNALPSFVDIDADGDLDFFMMGQKSTGNRFWFYRNTGTPQLPKFANPIGKAFKLEPPASFSPHPIYPSWGDMDCDGDIDLLVDFPDASGKSQLYYYKNTGTATNPIFPAWVKLNRDFMPMNNVVDFDGDGDLDVLTVNAAQQAVFYKNISPGPCVDLSKTPAADYSFERDGFIIHFTDQSIYPADECGITTWHWDFGDGKTSAEQNPVHNFKLKDRYNVCLTVGNAIGSHTACKSVHVRVAPAEHNLLADEEALKISPNPAENLLVLELEAGQVLESVEIVIFDHTGKQVKSLRTQPGSKWLKETISLEDLRGGVYTLRIQSDGQAVSRQFVKL